MRSCRYCTGFISCLSLLSHPHANGGNRCDDTGTVVSPEQARSHQAGCNTITLQLMVNSTWNFWAGGSSWSLHGLGEREVAHCFSWASPGSHFLTSSLQKMCFLYFALLANPWVIQSWDEDWVWVKVVRCDCKCSFQTIFLFYPWWNSLVRNNLLLSAVSLQTCWSPLILLPWTSLLLTFCQYPKLVTKIKGKK